MRLTDLNKKLPSFYEEELRLHLVSGGFHVTTERAADISGVDMWVTGFGVLDFCGKVPLQYTGYLYDLVKSRHFYSRWKYKGLFVVGPYTATHFSLVRDALLRQGIEANFEETRVLVLDEDPRLMSVCAYEERALRVLDSLPAYEGVLVHVTPGGSFRVRSMVDGIQRIFMANNNFVPRGQDERYLTLKSLRLYLGKTVSFKLLHGHYPRCVTLLE